MFTTTGVRKLISLILFLSMLSPAVFSQTSTSNNPDSLVTDLLRKLNDHEDIDKDAAVKYLHLDSIFFQEDPGIHSDSSLTFGPRTFWFVKFAAVVNCEQVWLIGYKKGSRVFENPLQIEKVCDFDLSGDHTGQKHFKIQGTTLYVYDNYYRIKGEDLVLVKKKSTYSAYRLPALTIVFKEKPRQ